MALHKLPKGYHPDFRLPNKKPVGGVDIDFANEFARDVKHVWGFSGAASINDGNPTGKAIPFLYDIVENMSGHTYLNSGDDAPESAFNTIGSALKYNGADSYSGSYLKSSTPNLLDDNDGTMVFAGVIDDTSGTQMLLGQANYAITPIYKYGCGLCIIDGVLYGFRSKNNTSHNVSLPISSGEAFIAVSFSGSSVTLSYNGRSVSGTCGTTGQSYDFGFGLSATVPSYSTSRAMMKGSLNYAFLTHRTWGKSSLNSLTSNVFQILKPKQTPIYFTSDAGGGTITVSPTLGTISYTGNNATVGLFGVVDVTATLGTFSYSSNNANVNLFGVVDVAAGLGAISYISNATTVQVTGSVDVTATLGAISYTSNNTIVDLGGAITVAAGLGTINYVSNDTIVGLAGQIDINATLGTISYTSNNTIVVASNGQSIGEVNTSFAGDLYGLNFKPNSITVTFRG